MASPFVIVPRGSAGPTGQLDLDPAFGELAVHAEDPRVTDLFLNGASGLFVDRGAGAEPVDGWTASEREVRELAVRLVALGGRHLDDQAPCVDVRLAAGVRVHAVLAPVASGGTAVSVRIPRVRAADLDDLAGLGAIDAPRRVWLEQTVTARKNVLITGGTGTGNTAWNL
ncbi:putative conjugal transfer protein [Microbacterium azadirachtae]|uniref:Putative conjugal transfer protein n=1 Tax=Microbacterium azadirachtae TaxID=582680 RepID=A0A0F0L2F9_9MICO|nr:ATPase, T2SS/T4P/T4SS family [Microbacterium azadirachtae]KJL26879.1 putative conjugal transfer protein [Microbacterium azadirachtae]